MQSDEDRSSMNSCKHRLIRIDSAGKEILKTSINFIDQSWQAPKFLFCFDHNDNYTLHVRSKREPHLLNDFFSFASCFLPADLEYIYRWAIAIFTKRWNKCTWGASSSNFRRARRPSRTANSPEKLPEGVPAKLSSMSLALLNQKIRLMVPLGVIFRSPSSLIVDWSQSTNLISSLKKSLFDPYLSFVTLGCSLDLVEHA